MNNYGINTQCMQGTAFVPMWNYAWGHEATHLSLAQAEAVLPGNDVHAELEAFTALSENSVFTLANARQNALVGNVVTAAEAPDLISNSQDWWFYYYTSPWDGWTYSKVTTPN
jgi:hypothetical protein